MKKLEDIDWSDPNDSISEFFTVHEALWLPSWEIHHKPNAQEKRNIHELAKRMDKVRAYLGWPIIVHCWIRPTAVSCDDPKYKGKNYNLFVGSTSLKSAHIKGKAVDWHAAYPKFLPVGGVRSCDFVRGCLFHELKEFGLRMENIQGSWIHTDTAPVGNQRFFKP